MVKSGNQIVAPRRNRVSVLTNGDDGVSAILVALSMFLLLGMGAVALDIGNTYQERRLAQNAADHAALTAAYTECIGGANPVSAGQAAAIENGFDDSDPNVTVSVTPQGPNEYLAEITTDIETTFGKVLGASEVGTSVSAVVSCAAGGGSGSTLHAHAGPGCGGDELHITSDDVIVNGGSHSNGDYNAPGDNLELLDGTTFVGGFSATGTGTVVDPSEQMTTTQEWPLTTSPGELPYDVSDYAPGGSLATAAGSDYHYHPSGYSVTHPVPAGLHYVDGNVDFADDFVRSDGGGVTIVASGTITVLADDIEFDHWEHDGNKGLLMFSNAGNPADPCSNILAIESRSDHSRYGGVLFAPYGEVYLFSDGSQSVAIWSNFVTLTGDPDIELSYPEAAEPGDPEMVFEQ